MAIDPRVDIGHVHLKVSDIDRALSFYRDVLGFETTGLYHVAIRYPTRAALADAVRRVLSAGVRLSGASDHGVSEAIYLHDPDRNGIELYWDRPKDQWPLAEDGVEMFTRPLDLEGLLREAP
jgi:catechol 2,3-dioxygenase